MRQQLDAALLEKVAQPRMELYSPHNTGRSDAFPTSQLIQAIIDLITQEDYTQQVLYVRIAHELPAA